MMRGAQRVGTTFLFLFVTVAGSKAQISQRSELGFALGTFNYTGDLVRTYNIGYSQPAGSVFYRNNRSQVISFKASLTGGKLKGRERPLDAFATQRAASFNLFLLEAATTAEYHFLDWRDSKRRLRFTPYLTSGLALFGLAGIQNKNAEYSNVQLAVPIGGGMKYVLNPKWYVAFEFTIRKTFFDYLDNISDGDASFKNYQYGNRFDTDNYFFVSLSLTRTFYDIPCAKNPY